ncbi:MAG: hypothetical protein EHM45_23305, partial [Desulfobacteraceae bacterium]
MSLRSGLHDSKRNMIKIKTSNKFLLGIVLLPLLVAVVTMLMVRDAFEKSRYKDYKDFPTAESTSEIFKTYDLKDFSGIDVSGNWEITFVQGASYRVEVSAPQRIMNNVRASVYDKQLSLDCGPASTTSERDIIPKATIVFPSLSTLNLTGDCHIHASDIRTDYLFISLNGNIDMTMENAAIKELNLIGDGEASIDFSRASTTNVRINYDGPHTMSFSMNSGRLSGKIDGTGTLTYSG